MSLAPAARPPRLHRPDSQPVLPARRRALWHQRLIDAEGGLRIGFRANSTLHVHLFAGAVVVISGIVLGLPFFEWILVGAAMAATLAAELFNLALQTLAAEIGGQSASGARKAVRLATAATLTVVAGSSLVTMGLMARRVWLLLG
jgi:diacylglycerol kinase